MSVLDIYTKIALHDIFIGKATFVFAARHRKFDIWFRSHAGKELEKYDTRFLVETVEIYASLIIHSLNSFKGELVKVFLSQVNEYDERGKY